MTTSISVEISCDPQKVFEFTTEDVSRWSTIVVSDEATSDAPTGVGTTFRTVVEDHGCRMPFEGKVTKHDPPTAHSVHMTGEKFDMDVDYTFEDLGGRTRVTQVSRVQPKGGMKIFFALFGWMMKRSGCNAARKELENLKRLLEESGE